MQDAVGSGADDTEEATFAIEAGGRRFEFDRARLSGDHIIEIVRTTGAFYEAELLDWLGTLRIPDGRFVDAGAFVGTHALYFAGVLGREVVAFEPNPEAYGLLTAHIERNGLSDRVRTVCLALSDAAGRGKLLAPARPGNLGSTAVSPAEGGNVRLARLDDQLEDPADIACIKIDVEGMEIAVLEGAHGVIQASRPLLLVECIDKPAFTRLTELLGSWRYRPIGIHAATPIVAFASEDSADAYFADGQAPVFDAAYHAYEAHIERVRLAGRQLRALNDATQSVERLPAQVASELGPVRRTLDALAANQRDVPNLVEAFSGRVASIGSSIDGLRDLISERATAEVDELRAQRDALRAEIADAKRRIGKLERARDEGAASADQAWGRLTEAEDRLKALRTRALEHNAALGAYKAAAVRVRDELTATRSSRSHQFGCLVTEAFRRPGVRMLALPWRVARLIGGRGNAPSGVSLPKAPRAIIVPKLTPSNRSTLTHDPVDQPFLGSGEAVRGAPGGTTVRRRRRPSGPFPISDLRVALVADEFTRLSFERTCDVCDLGADDWQEQIDGFEPDLLFVESAWQGRDGSWNQRLRTEDPAFGALMEAFGRAGVPRVFWNKEDPIHFDGWIAVAGRFDHVFTTDLESVPRYVSVLQHERIGCMPFACAPALTDPLREADRNPGFAFAGSYYRRYPDRAADFDRIADVIATSSGLTIYDRNYGSGVADFAFPERYRRQIRPGLPFDRIDEAYKGYAFGINMNSVKQSPTMFARRIFELMASNTVVVGNYSHGVRLLLGDLTVSSDSAATLTERLDALRDDTARERLTHRALRKVLNEHTYAHRLADVCAAVGIDGRVLDEKVAVLAPVSSARDVAKVNAAFEAQTYPARSLTLVADEGATLTPSDLPPTASLVWRRSAEAAAWGDAEGIAVFDPNATYGSEHLVDLVLSRRYAPDTDGATRPIGDERPFARARVARPAASLFTRAAAERLGSSALLGSEPVSGSFVTIGRGGDSSEDRCEVVTFEPLADEGVSMREVHERARALTRESIELAHDRFTLSGAALGRELSKVVNPSVRAEQRGDGTHLTSTLDLDAHSYVYGASRLELERLVLADGTLAVHAEITGDLTVRLVLAFRDAMGERVSSEIIPANRRREVTVPEGAVRVQVGFRVLGPGTAVLQRVRFGVPDGTVRIVVPRCDTLVLTQAYPSYEDIYRNGFVHRRVRTYRDRGKLCDVLRFDPTKRAHRYEFEGVDVAVGHQEELRSALATGRYRRVLVHFLDPDMWSVLKDHLPDIELTIWLHGSEVQPWHRRAFNYADDEERQDAMKRSATRMALWAEVFGLRHPRVRFVMVSEYARDEIAEDTGVTLAPWQYTIVHNFIDTSLFAYEPKPVDQRYMVLSIRPFASRKYANDQTVAAIQRLLERPDADRFEFRMIGDGPLFDATLEPLRGVPNVVIERGFLRQPEIAALHRTYGVWLSPTRMDWQGVSRDEAMSSGLVPVTTDVAAVPEFVSDAEGFLAPLDDPDALARFVGRLADDPELFSSLSAAAAARVRDQSDLRATILREMDIVWGAASGADE